MSTVATRPAKPSKTVDPVLFRAGPATVDPEQVVIDKNGGKYQSGIIRGVSLIATGEALGHGMWIDETTLSQVVEAGQLGKHGVKSRFTHPSMSADGMGRHLGRIHDVDLSGDRVTGDLHFAESSHSTPEGDLAAYVMTLTAEDPNAAGLSIVFEHDPAAEAEFMIANGATLADGRIDYSTFESPDPLNTNNYPHVRLASLRAADVVDEPAANPDGMFDRQSLARDADAFLSYAAGLADEKPTNSMFGVDADRAAQFFARWLGSHELSLTSKQELAAMAEAQTVEPTAAKPEVTRESLLAEQERYIQRFGAEDGVAWFTAGKDYTQSLEAFCDKQSAKIEELEAAVKESEDKFASLQIGEAEPVETQPGDESKQVTFAQATRASRN